MEGEYRDLWQSCRFLFIISMTMHHLSCTCLIIHPLHAVISDMYDSGKPLSQPLCQLPFHRRGLLKKNGCCWDMLTITPQGSIETHLSEDWH